MKKTMIQIVALLLVALILSPVVHLALAQVTTVVTCIVQDKNGDGLNDIVFKATDNTGLGVKVEVQVFLGTVLVFGKMTDAFGEAIIYDPPVGSYSWTSANGQSGTLQIGDPTFNISPVEEVLQWLILFNFMNSQNKGRSLCENIAKVLGYDLSANPLPALDGTNSQDNAAIAAAWIGWQNGLIEHVNNLKSTNVLSSDLSQTFLDILVATTDGLQAAKDWKETDQTTMKDVGVQGGEELELATPGTTTTLYDYEGGGLALASIVFSSLDILHLSSASTSVETVNPSGVTIDTRPIKIYADGLTIIAGFGNLIESLVRNKDLKTMGDEFGKIFGTAAAAFSAVVAITDIYDELQGKGLTEDLTDPQLWIQTLTLVKSFADIGVGLITFLSWEGIDTIGDVSLTTLGSTLEGAASIIGLVIAYADVISWIWNMLFVDAPKASEAMSPLLTQLWEIRSALNGIDPRQMLDDSTHSLDLSKAAGELVDQIDASGSSDTPIIDLRNQLYSAKHYWANLASAEVRLANDASDAVSEIDGFFAAACYVPTTFNIMTAHVSGILSVSANCQTSAPFSVNASYYQPAPTNPSLGDYLNLWISSSDGLSQDLIVSEGNPVDASYISRQETDLLGQKYPVGWAWDVPPIEQDASGNKLAVFYRPQSSFSPNNFLFDSDGSGTQHDDYYKYATVLTDSAGNIRPYYLLKFYFDNFYEDGLNTMQNTLFNKDTGMLKTVQSGVQQAETSLKDFEQASTFAPYTGGGSETVVYSEGFENSNGGYTHTGTSDQWQWGSPSYSKGPSSAHSGLKCWGTNLQGDVPKSSDSYLTSPPITLNAINLDYQTLRVEFYAWIAVDEMYDRGEFQVSYDGVSYATIAELFHIMQGTWSAYDFDISSFAGGNVYLRFLLHADGADAFSQSSYNMAGLYVDDIKITVYDKPVEETSLTLKAYEDQSSYASCPWISPWNGCSYVLDNDVYSTARGASNEYTDYYKLNVPLSPLNGKYSIELQEVTQETSFTDYVQLLAVDHSAASKIASDDKGNIWAYSNPVPPFRALDGDGNDVTAQLSSIDNSSVKCYDGNTITLDFSNVNTIDGATLIIQATGFLSDGSADSPTNHPASIQIQTQDSSQQWITRGTFYPRNNAATGAYNLAPYLNYSKVARIYVTSCNTEKYHAIDYVALDNQPQALNVISLSPRSATHSVTGDVCPALLTSDGSYVSMGEGENMLLSFDAPPITDQVRDFVFVAKGYYVPSGTYFIYTWDGAAWVERDAWSVSGNGNQEHTFDMSLFLPDPNGQYKVRIWQDYWYREAGIDYVALSHGSASATMASAFDQRKETDVSSLLSSPDGSADSWGPSDSGYPYSRQRNRFVDVTFTFVGPQNIPPSTKPVSVENCGTNAPIISWAYSDLDGDVQISYQVQVWTAPGGTGSIIWNPQVISGSATSMFYTGPQLDLGLTYYVRVKAFDGQDWGQWSECAFTNVNKGYNLPANADLGPTIGSSAGRPIVNWWSPTTFTYIDSSAISVDIKIQLDDGGSSINGVMKKWADSLWTYSMTFYPRSGAAYVTYTAHYSSSSASTTNFYIYVDPAGYVYDVNTNQRIAGATVWLQRPNGQGGWENVPTGQTPAIMQPDTNPQTTGTDGQYQWDVLEGSYRVHVEAAGYYPADSIVVYVPPPVTDLHVGLTPLPPPADSTPPTTVLTTGNPEWCLQPGGNIYVTSNTPFTISAEDNIGGSGVAATGYRIHAFDQTYDSGWTCCTPPTEFYLGGLADGSYLIDFNSTDAIGNVESTNTATVILDNTAPTTNLNIGDPKYISGRTYVTPDTPFTLTATDAGSGVKLTTCRVNSTSYDSGWLTYINPFKLSSLADGNYTIAFNSTDNVGNVETTHRIDVTLFSWNYVFKDSDGRGTILKICTAYKFFQFIAPDKDFGVRYASKMTQLCKQVIITCYEDSQMRLTATAVDDKTCVATVCDKQTGKTYWLIEHPPTYKLTVCCRDSNGKAISGASVYLNGCCKGQTDSYGNLVITNVLAGTYTVTVKKCGYKDSSSTTAVTGDTTLTITLTPQTYTLTVCCKDSKGKSISGVSVYVNSIYRGTTDQNGKLVITNITAGTYTVTVKKTGYKDTSVNVTISSDKTVTITMK